MHITESYFTNICNQLDPVLDSYILLYQNISDEKQMSDDDIEAAVKIKADTPTMFYLTISLIEKIAKVNNISIDRTFSILSGAVDILKKYETSK